MISSSHVNSLYFLHSILNLKSNTRIRPTLCAICTGRPEPSQDSCLFYCSRVRRAVYVMVPVPFKTTMGWNMYAWCATMFQGGGVGNLCHCEEALNGNSWHQRSQLTTRTITYWTKKPMEKQHRIYVIGFWVTDPIHVMIVLLQLIWVKKTEIFLFNYYTVMTTTVILIVY